MRPARRLILPPTTPQTVSRGTLALQNSTFELAGLNTQALAKATLSAGEGSLTHVGKGEQNIGGLAFNGGTVSFDGVTPGQNASGWYDPCG